MEVRARAGASVRRLRRECQWWSQRSAMRLDVVADDGFSSLVAEHASPTRRELAGVDPQLQINKETNLAIACAALDGRVLRPGQLFSFWRLVQRPTAARGFLPGVVLSQGRVVSGVGGGLCQLTNLLYWMTLHTPLTVTERWRHSYDVFPDSGRSVPFASGATCAWPSLDLQIRNDTLDGYRLSVAVVDGELRGAGAPMPPPPAVTASTSATTASATTPPGCTPGTTCCGGGSSTPTASRSTTSSSPRTTR